jgi:hypothetical protein
LRRARWPRRQLERAGHHHLRSGHAGPLQSVSDGGGTPVEITQGDKSNPQFTDRDPYFLPDGKHFLFVRRAKDSGSVYAASLDGGDIKQILPAGSNVAYSDGYLFYVKEGALTAQEFGPSSLTFKGKPVSIASNVDFAPARNEGFFSVSRNVLLYRPSSVVNRELAWLDLSGKEVDHWGEPAPYLSGRFSTATQTAVLLEPARRDRGCSRRSARPFPRISVRRTPPRICFASAAPAPLPGTRPAL